MVIAGYIGSGMERISLLFTSEEIFFGSERIDMLLHVYQWWGQNMGGKRVWSEPSRLVTL